MRNEGKREPEVFHAAIFIALRSERHGELEVLCGQNEVFNYSRNDPPMISTSNGSESDEDDDSDSESWGVSNPLGRLGLVRSRTGESARSRSPQPPIRSELSGLSKSRSLPRVQSMMKPTISIMRWPGEFRFPGGRQIETDQSPLETCLRALEEAFPGVKPPPVADVRATLFRKSVIRSKPSAEVGNERIFHVYTFIALVKDNSFLDIDVKVINSKLKEKRRIYHGRQQSTLSKEEKKSLNLRIHSAHWIPVSELLRQIDKNLPYVNKWQCDEFEKYGIKKREIELQTEKMLRELETATPQQLYEASLEYTIRNIATSKKMTEEEWKKELFNRGIEQLGVFNVNTVNLLSYNLNILPRGNYFSGVGHGAASERLIEFTERMCNSSYDVLALQEIFASPFLPRCHQRKFIRKMRQCGYPYVVTSSNPSIRQLFCEGKWTDGGLVILSKFPIVDHGSIRFHRGLGLDSGASKGVIYAKVKFGNRFLLVFNTHLQAGHTNSNNYPQIRKQQLLQLRRFIVSQCHKSPGSSWVLTGDFNVDAIPNQHQRNTFGYSFNTTSKDSEDYMNLVSTLSPDNCMIDLLKEKHNGNHPSTRPPRIQFPKGLSYMLYHKYPQRLDYVFFTPGSLGEISAITECTRIEKFEVTNPSKARFYTTLSDHYGIAVTLHCENTIAWQHKRRDVLGNVIARAATKGELQSAFMDYVADAQWPFFCLYLTLFALLMHFFYPVFSNTIHSGILIASFFCALLLLLREFLIGWHPRLLAWWKWQQQKEASEPPRAQRVVYLDTEELKAGYPHATLVHRSPLSPGDLVRIDPNEPQLTTLYDIFVHTVKLYGYRECAGTRPLTTGDGAGPYEFLTYDQIFRRVERFGSGLIKLIPGTGLKRGARIGILMENRPEWVICDQACFAYSLVSVPLFVFSEDFLKKLLINSRVSIVVCSRRWTQTVLKCAIEVFKELKAIIQVERLDYEEIDMAAAAHISLYDFTYVEKKGGKNLVAHRRPWPEDVATIVYKARRNNEPGGCVLTHANLVSSISALDMGFSSSREILTEHDVHFSFAPLAHIRERSILLYAIKKGMAVGFHQGEPTQIFADMQVLKPTILVGSPEIFHNLYCKFQQILKSWNPIYRFIFKFAYWRKIQLLSVKQKRLGSQFMDWIVFRRIPRIMGGNLRCIIMCGGVLATPVHQFVQLCFCCPVMHGLAFPETGGFITFGRLPEINWSKRRYDDLVDTMGYPLPCNEIKLIDIPTLGFNVSHTKPRKDSETLNNETSQLKIEDIYESGHGELCIRGPNVFKGYWNNEKLNEQKKIDLIENDGWWLTGKVCKFTVDGLLVFVGPAHDIIRVNTSWHRPRTLSLSSHIPRTLSDSLYGASPLHVKSNNEKIELINLARLENLYTHKSDFVYQIWVCARPAKWDDPLLNDEDDDTTDRSEKPSQTDDKRFGLMSPKDQSPEKPFCPQGLDFKALEASPSHDHRTISAPVRNIGPKPFIWRDRTKSLSLPKLSLPELSPAVSSPFMSYLKKKSTSFRAGRQPPQQHIWKRCLFVFDPLSVSSTPEKRAQIRYYNSDQDRIKNRVAGTIFCDEVKKIEISTTGKGSEKGCRFNIETTLKHIALRAETQYECHRWVAIFQHYSNQTNSCEQTFYLEQPPLFKRNSLNGNKDSNLYFRTSYDPYLKGGTEDSCTFSLPLVAVVSVDHEQLLRWSLAHNIHLFDISALCRCDRVHRAVLENLREIGLGAGLPIDLLVQAIHLVPFTFNTQNKLASPFSLRRNALYTRFSSILRAFYDSLDGSDGLVSPTLIPPSVIAGSSSMHHCASSSSPSPVPTSPLSLSAFLPSFPASPSPASPSPASLAFLQ